MLGRPEINEAAPYYFRYIDQVAGDDVLAAMHTQFDDTMSLLSSIADPRSDFCYAPEKWSIKQVLNHVSDTERAFAFRALWFARGFDSPLPSFDQNIAATGADADKIYW